ncbi:MAG: hypothetical protein ABJ081_03010 [Hyphomicrobiales bacterium]
MKIAQILIAMLGLVLTIMVVLAALEAPINESFLRITQDLWGWVTLLDLYLGFILIAIFIAIIERESSIAFMWIVPLFFLGNIWSALWFVIRFEKIMRKFS